MIRESGEKRLENLYKICYLNGKEGNPSGSPPKT
jgi:hypothetical protein